MPIASKKNNEIKRNAININTLVYVWVYMCNKIETIESCYTNVIIGLG